MGCCLVPRVEHAVEPGIAWDTPAVLQASKATLYIWKCSGVAMSCLRWNQGHYAQERHLNSCIPYLALPLLICTIPRG